LYDVVEGSAGSLLLETWSWWHTPKEPMQLVRDVGSHDI